MIENSKEILARHKAKIEENKVLAENLKHQIELVFNSDSEKLLKTLQKDYANIKKYLKTQQ